MLITGAIRRGLPARIAQAVAGQYGITVTAVYNAAHPEDAIWAHLAWGDRQTLMLGVKALCLVESASSLLLAVRPDPTLEWRSWSQRSRKVPAGGGR